MAINLLPEIKKKELEMEIVWRKILLCLIFVLLFFGFLIFILFSLKIYIVSQQESLRKTLIEKEKELKSSQFQSFKEIITKTNQDLSKIQKFWQEQILITPLLEKLSGLAPKSIYFTNFTFQRKIQEIKKKEKGKETKEIFAEIHISGFAQNREDLFFFKKNLESQESFQEIYFSPSSWVNPRDIEFSLSFKVKAK
jgi:hypothetical protein